MKTYRIQNLRKAKKQEPAQRNQNNREFFESRVQRKCEKCEEEENVQKKTNGEPDGSSKGFFGHLMNTLGTKGEFLPSRKRKFFENSMGDNFGNVKLHRDREAANAAGEIGAKAFTWKNHIVVNPEYLREGEVEGNQLLAHELKHVQQQKSGKHKIQMSPEENSGKSFEEGGKDMPVAEAATLETEAEREEERMLFPQAVPDFQTFGKPYHTKVYGNTISFRGTTDAVFNGGVGTTRNLKRTAAEDCENCAADDCWHYTGRLHINYHVSTTVTLPQVPEGLTECQQRRVRDGIDNILAPHEQDHVNAFNQYNGNVVLPVNYTGCSAGFEEYVQELHEINATQRQAAAQAASDALDPFHFTVDLDCGEDTTVPGDDAESQE